MQGENEKQLRYLQRFWKSIPANKAANDFLFKDNFFFNFLVAQNGNGTLAVFDERLVTRNEDRQSIQAYKDAAVVEYLIREDLNFTRDHEVMHTKVVAICPVILINSERKEVGWFYIPDVRNNRKATDEIEEIVTKLEKRNYASTIIRSTINNPSRNGGAVTPEEADAINLSPLEYESQLWIASVAGLR